MIGSVSVRVGDEKQPQNLSGLKQQRFISCSTLMSIIVRGIAAYNNHLGTVWSSHHFNHWWSLRWIERKKERALEGLTSAIKCPAQKSYIQSQGDQEVSLLHSSERRTSYWWAVQITNTVRYNCCWTASMYSCIHSFICSLIRLSLNGCYMLY